MNSLRLICRKSVCCFMFFFVSANSLSAQNRETTLHNLNNLLINTVMTDLFTPPVASRIYVAEAPGCAIDVTHVWRWKIFYQE